MFVCDVCVMCVCVCARVCFFRAPCVWVFFRVSVSEARVGIGTPSCELPPFLAGVVETFKDTTLENLSTDMSAKKTNAVLTKVKINHHSNFNAQGCGGFSGVIPYPERFIQIAVVSRRPGQSLALKPYILNPNFILLPRPSIYPLLDPKYPYYL